MATIIKFPASDGNLERENLETILGSSRTSEDLIAIDVHNVLGDEEATWLCNCGCWTYFLTKQGAKCTRCGLLCLDWAD